MQVTKLLPSCVSREHFSKQKQKQTENVAVFGLLIAKKYAKSCLTRLSELIMAPLGQKFEAVANNEAVCQNICLQQT